MQIKKECETREKENKQRNKINDSNNSNIIDTNYSDSNNNFKFLLKMFNVLQDSVLSDMAFQIV